jgi:nucleotide-binding universal stress UspA family protein
MQQKGNIMFKKILVATDLSEASERFICSLGSLKQIGTCQAVLIHSFYGRDVGLMADRLIELERQKRMLQNLGFNVTSKIVMGLPPIEINRQANDYDCSLIVVGSTGYTVVGEILLDSVASAVIHSANRPVLILRQKAPGEDAGKTCKAWECDCLRHVLFPTDFSDNAENAFTYVCKIASSGAKQITLLHVQDQARIDKYLKDRLEEFNRIDTGRLRRLKEELMKLGVRKISLELPYGSPKKEIIDRVQDGDVSLVVIGSQGRGYMGDIFLGSVSHAVARRSVVPVLLVPAIQEK